MKLYVIPTEFTVIAPDVESALNQLSSFHMVGYRDLGPTFGITDYELKDDEYIQEIVITDEVSESGYRNNH